MIRKQVKLISWNNNRIRGRRKRKKMMMMMDKDLIGKEMTTTISDLADEVLTVVLVVQKSWLSLIKTPMFITLHSNYHHQKNISSSNPNKYLLFWNSCKKVYELRVDDIQCEEYLALKFPAEPSQFGKFSCRLVSNGLICMYQSSYDTDVDIYLWNPVIQKHKILPNSPHTHENTVWKAIAFGFVPEINDYLVVYMLKHGTWNKPRTHSFVTFVYSLNTNSWRRISHDNVLDVHRVNPYDSFFVNGVAVWGALNSQRESIIMCFDTKTDVLREILLPECVDTNTWFPGIYPFGQSIVYFAEDIIAGNLHKLGMWVSKGALMNEFLWENKVMMRFQVYDPVHVMGLRNNGDPILCNSYGLISYNLDSHEFYDFVESWDHLTCVSPFVVKPFVESLGSINID